MSRVGVWRCRISRGISGNKWFPVGRFKRSGTEKLEMTVGSALLEPTYIKCADSRRMAW
jgi:hypothetical protein